MRVAFIERCRASEAPAKDPTQAALNGFSGIEFEGLLHGTHAPVRGDGLFSHAWLITRVFKSVTTCGLTMSKRDNVSMGHAWVTNPILCVRDKCVHMWPVHVDVCAPTCQWATCGWRDVTAMGVLCVRMHVGRTVDW